VLKLVSPFCGILLYLLSSNIHNPAVWLIAHTVLTCIEEGNSWVYF